MKIIKFHALKTDNGRLEGPHHAIFMDGCCVCVCACVRVHACV